MVIVLAEKWKLMMMMIAWCVRGGQLSDARQTNTGG
jgi:hypothetical protein